MKPQAEFELERTVLGSITILGRQLSSSAGNYFNRQFGVSIVDWGILAMLAQHSNLSARQISNLMVYDKALISRRLKFLNEAGYVLTKPDKKKRNKTQSSLTAKGKKLHRKILPIVEERESIFLTGFSKNEIESVKKFLTRFHENMPGILNNSLK